MVTAISATACSLGELAVRFLEQQLFNNGVIPFDEVRRDVQFTSVHNTCCGVLMTMNSTFCSPRDMDRAAEKKLFCRSLIPGQ
jgi:hypothetical protein